MDKEKCYEIICLNPGHLYSVNLTQYPYGNEEFSTAIKEIIREGDFKVVNIMPIIGTNAFLDLDNRTFDYRTSATLGLFVFVELM